MAADSSFDVSIVGGGLAGLTSAIYLSKMGWSVVLYEKRSYPEHRVCGEYVSNEVIPFLNSIEAFPEDLNPKRITRFELSSTSGNSYERPLDLGGFGISRFSFDHFLFNRSLSNGVKIMTNTPVDDISFQYDRFKVTSANQSVESKVVVGSFGKRSSLDKTLNRPFFKNRSPYVGVKYHLDLDYPDDKVALHNFDGGYCGLSKVENGALNVCYLAHRSRLKSAGSIENLEVKYLYKNPILREIFNSSKKLFASPFVINEVSFETKEPLSNHILMTGDSAGMITPLCGNGMAMAIHSAKICSELINLFLEGEISRTELEIRYTKSWRSQFAFRLKIGRVVQKLFGSKYASSSAVAVLKYSPFLGDFIISNTHGEPF